MELKLSSKDVEAVFEELCATMEMKGQTILNQGVIEIAIFKANKEKDIFSQAAVAMYEIAQGHAFSDGNKRAAYLIASYILWEKGYKIKANPNSTIKLLLRIAQKKANLREVKEWIKKHTIKA